MREGLLAEFESPERLVEALRSLRESGYRDLDAHTPYPVEGVDALLEAPRPTVARYTLAGGVTGALTGYLGQYWLMAIDYPLNVGGRPLHSAPAMIPITFELTILFASLATILGLFVRARLGLLWQPEDDAAGFESASIDRFWIAVGAGGPDAETSTHRLRELGALRVSPFGGRP